MDLTLNDSETAFRDEVRSWLEAVGASSREYPHKAGGWGELYEYAWRVYQQLLEGEQGSDDAR